MKIRYNILQIMLMAAGICGMLFFTTVDFIRPGAQLEFGRNQLAGFVISTILVLAATHKTQSSRSKTWFGALMLIYIAGILFMGLKPAGHYLNSNRGFLITSSPPVFDFVINILGFIPFAYLSMTYHFSNKKLSNTVIPVLLTLAAGTGVSFIMELAQYYIPGRTSSLMDLIANTAGTLIGLFYFLLEKKLADYR